MNAGRDLQIGLYTLALEASGYGAAGETAAAVVEAAYVHPSAAQEEDRCFAGAELEPITCSVPATFRALPSRTTAAIAHSYRPAATTRSSVAPPSCATCRRAIRCTRSYGSRKRAGAMKGSAPVGDTRLILP